MQFCDISNSLQLARGSSGQIKSKAESKIYWGLKLQALQGRVDGHWMQSRWWALWDEKPLHLQCLCGLEAGIRVSLRLPPKHRQSYLCFRWPPASVQGSWKCSVEYLIGCYEVYSNELLFWSRVMIGMELDTKGLLTLSSLSTPAATALLLTNGTR